MQTYAKYAPTPHDVKGLGLPTRQSWLVLPVIRNRNGYGSIVGNSNFETALAMLGGESKGVEIHRYNHWAHSFEIILVNPRSRYAPLAEAIEDKLADYPLLDENDVSNREHAAYCEAWETAGNNDFQCGLAKAFGLNNYRTSHLVEFLDELPADTMRAFFESLITSGDYHDGEGSPRIAYAVERCSMAKLVRFVRKLRREREGVGATLTRFMRYRYRIGQPMFPMIEAA